MSQPDNSSSQTSLQVPENPAGVYTPDSNPSETKRKELIQEISDLPSKLEKICEGFSVGKRTWDTLYKKWTAKQIVHHIADSHANGYIRLKLTLTEEQPTVKPYHEGKWAEVIDSKESDVETSLSMIRGIHARWAVVLRNMSSTDFERTYFHPEYKKVFKYAEVLGLYAHHGRHHSAQLQWIKDNVS